MTTDTITWRTDNAPTGGPVLAKMKNLPYPIMVVWNAPAERWAGMMLQVGLFMGVWNDYYFESKFFYPDELVNWAAIPGVVYFEGEV